MALLENSLLIIGAAMCVLAVLPLAFWSAQSWTMLRRNRVQFHESQQLLRQQILAANAQRVADNQTMQTHDTVSSSNSATVPLQEIPVVAKVPQATVVTPVAAGNASEVTVQPDGRWRGFRKFRVEKLVKETAACTSVYLVPVDGKSIASFKAGQHLAMRFHIPGQPKPVIRCYSLSNGPGKPYYRISVKAIAEGKAGQAPGLVSNFVNSQLQQGDVIGAKAPAGSFFLDLSDSRPVVMLAGGIGVTPMISIVNSIQNHSPDRLAILFYGVRNKSDLAFANELQGMKGACKNFHVVYCFSDPSPEDVHRQDYQVKGHVSVDLIKQLLPHSDCQFFLCGPPAFMQSLGEGLESWGVPEDQVKSEAFGPASLAKTRPAVLVPESVGAIEIAFNETNQPVTWDPNCESLLELAESNGVDIDFGCRAGSCGTCAMELLSGEVRYPEDLQVDCEPGQCLTCVARPIGSIKLGAQA